MSYTFSKTFSRISVPDNVAADVKHAELIEYLTGESLNTWFSGHHPMDGCCDWDYIAEEYGNEDQTAFANREGAKNAIQSMIEGCLSIRCSTNGAGLDLQVYRDSDTYCDEIYDYIITGILHDSDFNLKTIKTTVVVEDSREGISAFSYLSCLNQNNEQDIQMID